jgi:hypothetical protein
VIDPEQHPVLVTGGSGRWRGYEGGMDAKGGMEELKHVFISMFRETFAGFGVARWACQP